MYAKEIARIGLVLRSIFGAVWAKLRTARACHQSSQECSHCAEKIGKQSRGYEFDHQVQMISAIGKIA